MMDTDRIGKLRKRLIEETEKRLKDGRLDKKINVPIFDDDGNFLDKFEEREVDDPALYLKYKIDTYKVNLSMSEENAMNLIARSEYGIDTKAPMTESEIYDLMESKIGNIKPNDKMLTIRAKVLDGYIRDIVSKKDGRVWKLGILHIADDTGVAEVSIFYNNRYDELFEKIRDKSIRGENVYLEGFDAVEDNFSPFPFVLKPSRSGASVSILDEDVKTIDYITPIDSINEATKYVNIRGKVSNIGNTNTFTYKRGAKAGKDGFVRSFKLSDKEGRYVNVNAWDDAVDDIPSEGTIIEIIGAPVSVDKMEQRKGNKIYSIDVRESGRFIEISGNPDEYADELVAKELPTSTMIEANIGDLFESVVTLYGLRWTKRETDTDGRSYIVKRDPYYISCNRTDGDFVCNKKAVLQKDGTYECADGHSQTAEDVKKLLLVRANVFDGTLTMEGSFFHRDAEAIFGKSGDEIIEEYEESGTTTEEKYDRFFTKYNQTLSGKTFKIRGVLYKDGDWGVKLRVMDIKPIDLNDAIQEKLKILTRSL